MVPKGNGAIAGSGVEEEAIRALANLLKCAQPDETGVATANLLAQLLSNKRAQILEAQETDGDCCNLPEDAIAAFTAFIFRGFETGGIRQLSSADTSICHLALNLASHSLVRYCMAIAKHDTSSVPILQGFVKSYVFDDSLTQFSEDAIDPSAHSRMFNILAFMKDFLPRIPESCCETLPTSCLVYLLFLVGASEQLSNEAKNVILVVLSGSRNGRQPFPYLSGKDDHNALVQIFTQGLLELVSKTGVSHHKTNALAIWLRLLSLESIPWQIPPDAQRAYWEILHDFLSQGTRQQQKSCIAILSGSLSSKLLAEDPAASGILKFGTTVNTHSRHQVNKFAVIYETMILAGYLNQVQACIPDLDLLCSPSSTLNPPWLVSLLCAGLRSSIHESVRNTLGYWVLRSNPEFLNSAFNTPNFIESTFLSWASQASHYHNSVVTLPDGIVQCCFGDSLVKFLLKVIQSPKNACLIIKAILKFLVAEKNRIFPFAKICMLEALILCLNVNAETFDNLSIRHLVLLMPEHDSKDVFGDLIATQIEAVRRQVGCASELSDNGPIGTHDSRLDDHGTKWEADFSAAYRSLRHDGLDLRCDIDMKERCEAEKALPVLEHFIEMIRAPAPTRYRLAAVASTCDFLYGILQCLHDSKYLDSHCVCKITAAIQTIWSNIESEKFPKTNTYKIVSVAFHPKCIELTSKKPELAAILNKIAAGLLELSKSRIYIFPTLAAAFHFAFLSVKQAENLSLNKLVENWASKPPRAGSATRLEGIAARKFKNTFRHDEETDEFHLGSLEEFGHACFYDLLNSLPVGAYWDACLKDLLDKLLKPWIDQKQPVPIVTAWKTTQQLQVILMCFERLLPKFSSRENILYLEKLYEILKVEPLPKFRFLLEWIISRVLRETPSERDFVFQLLLSASTAAEIQNPKFIVSMLRISQQLLSWPDASESWAFPVMSAVLTLASSQRVQVLYEAKWTFLRLWHLSVERDWNMITSNGAFRHMLSHIQNLAKFKETPLNRRLEQADLLSNHHLTFLVQGQYLMVEPKEKPIATRENILAVRAHSGRESTTNLLQLGTLCNTIVNQLPKEQAATEPSGESEWKIPLQTKSEVLQPDKESKTGNYGNSVIVVASLVESMFNLGGITRTSEIFGVQTLKIKDAKVTQKSEFKSVSVASDLWLNIEELSARDMLWYIRQCKTDGYRVVGVEQTDSSKTLGAKTCVLPKRLVLVLGSEREGIPADLLSEMDLCIEICQFGVTRSMNVQGALSIALYEYHRQNSGGSK